jgi:Mn-dependent DtxR family transcriptional regulator
VGQRCRQATIKDIAEELKLDWDTVKTRGVPVNRFAP